MKRTLCLVALGVLSVLQTISAQQRPTRRPVPAIPQGVQLPSLDNVPVAYLILEAQTCDQRDAGSDSPLTIRFSPNALVELDDPGDDRQRGQWDRWGLAVEGITLLRDIQFLIFEIQGRDGWCVQRVRLFANGGSTPIFDRSFAQWLDTDDNPVLRIDDLRADIGWSVDGNRDLCMPNDVIPHDDIVEVQEGVVGNLINNNDLNGDGVGDNDLTDLYWGERFGSDFVELTKKSETSIAVDLDLQLYLNNLPDPNVDVDFDLAFSCTAGKTVMTMTNGRTRASFPWWFEWVADALTGSLWRFGLSGTFDAGFSKALGNTCVPISVMESRGQTHIVTHGRTLAQLAVAAGRVPPDPLCQP
jgi:hypothetical protein